MFRFFALDSSEIGAIDWVGGRYSWGDACCDFLAREPDDIEGTWKGPGLYFNNESDLWNFETQCQQDSEGGHSLFPCASPKLTAKLQFILDSIV